MADSEFEQFRRYFDRLPQYIKAPAHSYTLVHDILLDEGIPDEARNAGTDTGVSSASSSSSGGDSISDNVASLTDQESLINDDCGGEEEDEEAPWRVAPPVSSAPPTEPLPPITPTTDLPPLRYWERPITGARRRRKLPEIPKNKKSSVLVLSLADELGEVAHRDRTLLPESVQMALMTGRQSVGAFQLRGDTEEFSSPESGPLHYTSLDADSGHSTTNSPDGPASLPGAPRRPASASSTSTCFCGASDSPRPALGAGGVAYPGVERLVATHRGLHKFVPRHRDEIEMEIGDPVYVQRECDDLWCEGVNMRTRRQGSFPSAYAVDLDYTQFDPEVAASGEGSGAAEGPGQRDRFLLDYLGSMESLHHKGNPVLCAAVRRIQADPPATRPVILEVSDKGLRMLGREKQDEGDDKKALDYFYSLKNVSFCGFHPRDQRFLGFITKHPQRQRFACHVFRGEESMRPVAETIGRAFERFYQKFIETAYPTEDIYIE